MLEHLQSDPRVPARTVVLGASGFVGGAIAACLQRRGASLLALGSKELDLLAPDAAVALAARLAPGDALVFVSALAPCRDNDALVKNLRMAETVCAALGAVRIRQLVYVSSDAVYADDVNPVSESSCASPSTLHGIMHIARELMLRHSVDGPLAVLRPSLIYGAADPHNGYGPNRFLRSGLAEGRVSLFGEGEEERDHVYIDDVARLTLGVLEHGSRGVLNVATGRSRSFRAVAECVAAELGRAVAIAGTPRRNPVSHRVFDVTAISKAFPSFRFTPLEQGIRQARDELIAKEPQRARSI